VEKYAQSQSWQLVGQHVSQALEEGGVLREAIITMMKGEIDGVLLAQSGDLTGTVYDLQERLVEMEQQTAVDQPLPARIEFLRDRHIQLGEGHGG
jgi:hypothetical protein